MRIFLASCAKDGVVCWEKKVKRAAITSQRLTARLSHLILADRDTTAATIGRASKGCQLNV